MITIIRRRYYSSYCTMIRDVTRYKACYKGHYVNCHQMLRAVVGSVRTTCLFLGPLLGLLLGVNHTVQAAGYQFDVGLTLEAKHDNNLRLLNSGDDSQTVSTPSANAKLALFTEQQQLTSHITARSLRYSNDSLRNDDELTAAFDYVLRHDQLTTQFGIDADQESTLTTEFDTTGVSLEDNKTRNTRRYSVGQTYGVTERQSLSYSIARIDVDYEDIQFTSLADYTYDTLSAGWNYQLSERLTLVNQPSYSRYRADRFSSETDTTAYQVGGLANVSERQSIRLFWGWRNVEVQRFSPFFGKLTSEENGRFADLNWRYQGETYRFSLGFSDQLSPGSNGTLTERQRWLFDYKWEFSQLNQLDAGIEYSEQQRIANVNGLDNSSERNYGRLRLGLRFRVNQSNYIRIALGHRVQDREDNSGRTESSSVALSWQWQRPTQRDNIQF